MSTNLDLTGFVLAGGKSARMGRDKALLDWHGRTLLQHMIDLISTVASPVFVAGRELLPDGMPDRGPMAGIATALETSKTEAILVVAVDLPLLTEEFLKYFKYQAQLFEGPLVACRITSGFPLSFILRRSLLPEIRKRITAGDLSIHSLIESTAQSRVI